AIDLRRFTFYLWAGSAYLALWLFVDMATHPAEFRLWALNEIWRAVYIVVVNYLFFEYTLLQLSRKRIFRSFVLIVVQVFLFSFGLYAWRNVGIKLGIHTSFTTYSTFSSGVGDQFGASLFSFLFFV